MAAQNRLLAGQITVTTSGTAVQGTDVPAWQPAEAGGGFFVFALSTNTGNCYVGNDGAGDVTSSNGFELIKGSTPMFVRASNLNEYWFDALNNGDKVCWIRA